MTAPGDPRAEIVRWPSCKCLTAGSDCFSEVRWKVDSWWDTWLRRGREDYMIGLCYRAMNEDEEHEMRCGAYR